jgi:hypothetical protein
VADPTLVAAQKLRAYEEAHPVQAILGGFTPGIGQASAAAALRDPDAPWWEKGLNAVGLVPGAGGAAKALVIGAKMAKGSDALEGSLKMAQKLALKIRKAEESADPSKGARGISDLVQGDPRINDRIFKETGWWYDPESRKWMTEIDDSMSSPDYRFLEEAELNQMFGKQGQNLELGEAMRHPELERLPEGQNLMRDVLVERDTSLGARSGEYRPTEDQIAFGDQIEPASMSPIRDTMLHETQHAIAAREGFPRGTNSTAAGGYENYLKDPGEQLARVAALRRNMTPEARRKFPFYRHMDEENYRLSIPGQARRYAKDEDLKRALMLRNLDPEEMLVRGP